MNSGNQSILKDVLIRLSENELDPTCFEQAGSRIPMLHELGRYDSRKLASPNPDEEVLQSIRELEYHLDLCDSQDFEDLDWQSLNIFRWSNRASSEQSPEAIIVIGADPSGVQRYSELVNQAFPNSNAVNVYDYELGWLHPGIQAERRLNQPRLVQSRSSSLAADIIETEMGHRCNLVIGISGTTNVKVTDQLQSLSGNGYLVSALVIDDPFDVVWNINESQLLKWSRELELDCRPKEAEFRREVEQYQRFVQQILQPAFVDFAAAISNQGQVQSPLSVDLNSVLQACGLATIHNFSSTAGSGNVSYGKFTNAVKEPVVEKDEELHPKNRRFRIGNFPKSRSSLASTSDPPMDLEPLQLHEQNSPSNRPDELEEQDDVLNQEPSFEAVANETTEFVEDTRYVSDLEQNSEENYQPQELEYRDESDHIPNVDLSRFPAAKRRKIEKRLALQQKLRDSLQ